MKNKYITSSGFIEDVDLFNHFKERADLTLRDEPECIDEDILQHITELNKIPGLATVWCCQGHLDEDSDKFHIIFVIASETAYRTLEAIVCSFNNQINLDEWNGDFAKHLSLTKFGMLITEEYNDGLVTYPVISMDTWSSPTLGRDLLDLLLECIKSNSLHFKRPGGNEVLVVKNKPYAY